MFEELLNHLLNDMETVAGWFACSDSEEENWLEDMEEVEDEL